jgi:hypothetical protein
MRTQVLEVLGEEGGTSNASSKMEQGLFVDWGKLSHRWATDHSFGWIHG